MSKQEIGGVRSLQELELKYAQYILNIKETLQKNLTKVDAEINNILNSLLINLSDYLEGQTEFSLWFYEGVPDTTNEPYISWDYPENHIGDVYYDQSTGYVYQYETTGWNKKEDVGLVQAMALTNVEIDTTLDHERKVYLSQPSPPYNSGDWWILEDGTLKICQISKKTLSNIITEDENQIVSENGDNLTDEVVEVFFEEDDFIVSSKYVATVASKTGDSITVLKGTVTRILDSYVSITDLATGGSTVIAGENITTGKIKSANYSDGISGTQINLTTGEIKTPNAILDNLGLKLKNGAKVVGENGLLNTYIFTSNNFEMCGYEGDDPQQLNNSVVIKKMTKLIFNIPPGLNIISAKVVLFHAPTFWGYQDINYNNYNVWGYGRNLKLYKSSNINNRRYTAQLASEYLESDATVYSEILNALGSNGWTPSVPNSYTHDTETYTSMDIKGSVDVGLNEISIQPGDNGNTSWSAGDICQRSAFVYAIIKIDGYMSYD